MERKVAEVVHKPGQEAAVTLNDHVIEDDPEEANDHQCVGQGADRGQSRLADRRLQVSTGRPDIDDQSLAKLGSHDQGERDRDDRTGSDRGELDADDVGQDESNGRQGDETAGGPVRQARDERRVVVVGVADERATGNGGQPERDRRDHPRVTRGGRSVPSVLCLPV